MEPVVGCEQGRDGNVSTAKLDNIVYRAAIWSKLPTF